MDPLAVILWQLKYCDIGVILDEPPASITRADLPWGDPAGDWEQSMHLTAEATKRVIPTYLDALDKGSDFRLWGVVHGESYEQLERWHRTVSDIYPFTEEGEGWAFKAFPPTSASGTAQCLCFIKSQCIRRAHFFQTGGVKAATTLLCLGPEAGLDFVSYDATTPITQGNYRSLIIPDADSLGWEIETERFRETGDTSVRDYMKNECPCSSCQWLREDLEECPDIEDEYFKFRMIFHNVLTAVKVFDALFEASKQDPRGLLREKLGKEDYKATLRSFKPLVRGAT